MLLSGSAESSFGERTEAAEQALESATLLTDQSHWGVIRVGGEDRLRFLHSQGTNAFEGVAEGEANFLCFFPLVTSQLTVHRNINSIILCIIVLLCCMCYL